MALVTFYLGLFCLGLFCLVSWDYFVWDCFVWESFAIWDCFVWDCFVWDCFVRTRQPAHHLIYLNNEAFHLSIKQLLIRKFPSKKCVIYWNISREQNLNKLKLYETLKLRRANAFYYFLENYHLVWNVTIIIKRQDKQPLFQLGVLENASLNVISQITTLKQLILNSRHIEYQAWSKSSIQISARKPTQSTGRKTRSMLEFDSVP